MCVSETPEPRVASAPFFTESVFVPTSRVNVVVPEAISKTPSPLVAFPNVRSPFSESVPATSNAPVPSVAVSESFSVPLSTFVTPENPLASPLSVIVPAVSSVPPPESVFANSRVPSMRSVPASATSNAPVPSRAASTIVNVPPSMCVVPVCALASPENVRS